MRAYGGSLAAVDILLVLPWFEREYRGDAIAHHAVDLAGAMVAARGDAAEGRALDPGCIGKVRRH
jgi:hypothetical protein